ncbi:MAG: hypothetical protein ACJAS1_004665 [Oleiphilaceae bacterium]|jgi:hypothetical protein
MTADIASVLRIPETLNHKDIPTKPVTFMTAIGKRINSDAMLKAIKISHHKLCIKPEKEVIVVPALTFLVATSSDPESEKLKSALLVLDPDCSEEIWKLNCIAPLALFARQHPEYALGIEKIAKGWSRGDLQAKPSITWLTQGNIGGLTGEQVFKSEWQRFL